MSRFRNVQDCKKIKTGFPIFWQLVVVFTSASHLVCHRTEEEINLWFHCNEKFKYIHADADPDVNVDADADDDADVD